MGVLNFVVKGFWAFFFYERQETNEKERIVGIVLQK